MVPLMYQRGSPKLACKRHMALHQLRLQHKQRVRTAIDSCWIVVAAAACGCGCNERQLYNDTQMRHA